MTAVAAVIAALLLIIAAALWLELRAERQAAARILASYLLDAREGPPVSLLRVLGMRPCLCGDCCQCGDWLAECPVHTADFWRGQLEREPTS